MDDEDIFWCIASKKSRRIIDVCHSEILAMDMLKKYTELGIHGEIFSLDRRNTNFLIRQYQTLFGEVTAR